MIKRYCTYAALISCCLHSSSQVNAQPFNPLLASMLQDTLSTYFSAVGNIKGMSAAVYLQGKEPGKVLQGNRMPDSQ